MMRPPTRSTLFPYTTLFRSSVEELDAIPEIGLTVAESVRDWFNDEGNRALCDRLRAAGVKTETTRPSIDRKSTRLNSSHSQISYAVFCLKKKNYQDKNIIKP